MKFNFQNSLKNVMFNLSVACEKKKRESIYSNQGVTFDILLSCQMLLHGFDEKEI